MEHHELVIVGAGPGGYVAAIKAAQLGIETALIERADVGGTCLNRGCIPTKTLLHTAEVFTELAHAEALGLRIEGASIDFPVLKTRKEAITEQLRGGVESLLEANGVTLIRGAATICAPGKVSVVTVAEGDAEDAVQDLEADNIIIASGSSPAMPPIAGIESAGVYTSDTLLEEVPNPGRLAIIGGGVIGMEFAGIYTALGTQVTVLEAADRILPILDREFGQSLSMTMKKRGCAIAAKAFVKAIEKQDDGSLIVRYAVGENEEAVEADAVLVSTGRTAETRGLFTDGFEVELDRGRIAVDEHMRTSIPQVYAIGDVANAGIQLAHAASAQGIIAVSDIAGAECAIDPILVPSCVYSSPEIASVGMTEAEAKEAGIACRVGKFTMAGNGKTTITNQDRSFMKVVADEQDRIIGAQLMCGRATDMIGEFTLAISQGLTLEQMASITRPHPTFEEAIGEVVESLLGGAIHARPARKAKV